MPCGADSRIDYVTYGLRENIPAMRKLLASGWTDSAISNYYAIPQYTARRLRRLNDKSVLDYYVSAVCARFESPEYMTMDPLTSPTIYDPLYKQSRAPEFRGMDIPPTSFLVSVFAN